MSFQKDEVITLLESIKSSDLKGVKMKNILDKMCMKVVEDGTKIDDLLSLFKDSEKDKQKIFIENVNNAELEKDISKKKQKKIERNIKEIISRSKSTITLTFCDASENHVGMMQNGKKGKQAHAFTKEELDIAKQKFEDAGYICEMIHLNTYCNKEDLPTDKLFEDAYVLIVKRGVVCLMEDKGNMEHLFKELTSFEWDTKYWDTRRKKVLNKNARANVCMGKESTEPDYENKKGRIVAYNDLPITSYIKDNLIKYIGEKGTNLECEGNLYFDKDKCGIGFHGDYERVKVIGVRLGAMKLVYNWYYNSKPIGEKCVIELDDSDLYFMSGKSVGNDWKCKSKITLRHAAGCDYYTTIKTKNNK